METLELLHCRIKRLEQAFFLQKKQGSPERPGRLRAIGAARFHPVSAGRFFGPNFPFAGVRYQCRGPDSGSGGRRRQLRIPCYGRWNRPCPVARWAHGHPHAPALRQARLQGAGLRARRLARRQIPPFGAGGARRSGDRRVYQGFAGRIAGHDETAVCGQIGPRRYDRNAVGAWRKPRGLMRQGLLRHPRQYPASSHARPDRTPETG